MTFMVCGALPSVTSGTDAWWQITDAEAYAVLDYIRYTLKQRFIAICIMNYAWWEHCKQALIDFWFPKCYERQMWVFLWLAQLSQENSDENWDNPYTATVESYGGSLGVGYLHPPELEADWWRHKLEMVTENPSWSEEERDRYSNMVVAVCGGWELGSYWSKGSLPNGYTMQTWTEEFRSLTIPILEQSRIGKVAYINKLWGGTSSINGEVDRYSDVSAPDMYVENQPSSFYDGDGDGQGDALGFIRKRFWSIGETGKIEQLLEQYRPDPYKKIPWTDWKIWFPETNLYNPDWNSGPDYWSDPVNVLAFQEWVNHDQFGMLAFWTMGPCTPVYPFRAFHYGGTPRPWLEALASYFPPSPDP